MRSVTKVLAAVTVLALSFPAILLAHAKLVRSEPANGAILTASPLRIVLVFTEVPALALSRLRLITPASDTVVMEKMSHHVENKHILHAEIPQPLPNGHYILLWRVAGDDGHARSGSVQFDIADTAASAVPSVTDSLRTIPAPEVERIAVGGPLAAIFARWLSFIAIFVIAGIAVFRNFILPRSATPDGLFSYVASTISATLGLFASAAGIIAAMLKLTRESADMPDASLTSLLFGSWWGVSVALQVIGCIVALAAFVQVHRSHNAARAGAGRGALAAAAILAVSPSLGGHAVSSGYAVISVAADFAHVLFGSVWLGTLTTILVAGIPAAYKAPDEASPSARVAVMINVFSPVALASGGLVVATGIVSSLMRLPSLDALWSSPYGTALMFKLVLVAVLFAAGAFNWRRMKPRLSRDYAVAQLRSAVRFELVIGLAVLAVTAMLVALELP